MTTSAGLSGKGLQQTPEQWAQRGQALSAAMAGLIRDHRPRGAEAALDVGCQAGSLIDTLARLTGMRWQGVDPGIAGETRSPEGARLIHGFADGLDFPDQSFDVLMLANVFEHILPARRVASMREMARVLRPGGVLVGQIPNPYFFVESHSRLPFMGWLPIRAQRRYWRLSSVPWDHDFYVVTLKHVAADAASAGLRLRSTGRFNYPVEVYPDSVQRVIKLLRPVMKRFPWAWQFVLVKP